MGHAVAGIVGAQRFEDGVAGCETEAYALRGLISGVLGRNNLRREPVFLWNPVKFYTFPTCGACKSFEREVAFVAP